MTFLTLATIIYTQVQYVMERDVSLMSVKVKKSLIIFVYLG